jgi:hypothetical protein
MIIEEATKRLGETTYNLINDNCQNFCFLCRYGESRSPEVEETFELIERIVTNAIFE